MVSGINRVFLLVPPILSWLNFPLKIVPLVHQIRWLLLFRRLRRFYFVAAYGPSSTRIEHRLVQAANDYALSVVVPAIFDVKQTECGTPLEWVTVQPSVTENFPYIVKEVGIHVSLNKIYSALLVYDRTRFILLRITRI